MGWGREGEEGRGSGGVEGSSKWKRGEGNREIESDTLIEEVVQIYM